jgi:hypothetical protein
MQELLASFGRLRRGKNDNRGDQYMKVWRAGSLPPAEISNTVWHTHPQQQENRNGETRVDTKTQA